jgi:hypothetical protein
MKIGIPVEMMSDELPDIKQRIDSLLMEDETTWMSAEEYLSEEEREEIIRDIKEDRNIVSLDDIPLKERDDLLRRDRRRFHMI